MEYISGALIRVTALSLSHGQLYDLHFHETRYVPVFGTPLIKENLVKDPNFEPKPL